MKRSIIYLSVAISLSTLAGSCKKFIDIPPPRLSLNNELVFRDDKTAEAAVVGIYSNMNGFNSSFANTQASFYPSFAADDFLPNSPSGDGEEFSENALTPGNSILNGLWSEPYSYIYHANAIIEGVSGSQTLTAAKATQLIGEAKFVRAFCYFYLVNYFGNVPLVMNTDFKTSSSLPKTDANIVYDTIVNDLKAAQTALSDNYPGTSQERTRPNKTAATALLARVYLYRKDWPNAEAEANKVLTNPKYKLTALNDVFLKNSQEAIWQLQALNTVTADMINTWEGYSILPAAGASTVPYVMYPNFLTSLESGDNRATSWITTYTFTPPTGPPVSFIHPFKYKTRVSKPAVEYSMILRRAEQFLIRAEARAQQNKLPEAKSDLDSIRLRAGLTALPAGLTQPDLILAVEKERKAELFGEWGHRWFDLRRTGRSVAVLGAIKPGFTDADLWFPIPLEATLTNPNL